MFEKILIANRGEIACRIIHTAKSLGIKTVAVYSEADAHAPHVKQADEAYFIGPPPASQSYLRADKILDIALKSGAEAIHPGYGFLSENADFAQECAQKGITFIGPSPEAIRIMGSKSESKALMEKVGVPTTPGYHGEDQSVETLTQEAARIGFPLMIKASAGGGGKGMRIVQEASQLTQSLESAQREVASSFKDGRLLLEKFIEGPRHIEVQVFGDTHGNLVHLFERDCSIQRRYQKIVEEAPGNISDPARERLYKAALEAARAVQYVGAGTVEFLMNAQENFYFMEMNTRLQVEHPVTEMITNQDLVEWQLRVAAGAPLPLTQEQLTCHGSAIEVRLCAENPSNDFLPTTGTLTQFKTPKDLRNGRYDTGVERGSVLSVHYDPMIAKVIAWGETRPKAISKLQTALKELKISGVHTNKSYLSAILKHESFQKGAVTTQFVDHYHQGLLKADQPPLSVILQGALADLYLQARTHKNPFTTEGLFWRMNGTYTQDVTLTYGTEGHLVTVTLREHTARLTHQNKTYEARIHQEKSTLIVELLDERLRLESTLEGSHLSVDYHGETYTFDVHRPGETSSTAGEAAGHLSAPMPGKVMTVMVTPGDSVKAGDTLLVLEAMKMEHAIKAPFEGTVENLPFSTGDLVEDGVELVSLSPLEEKREELSK